MFLHDEGLRVGEMTALLWKDVDLDKRMITIRDNRGSNDFCTLPLTTRATRMLRAHQKGEAKSDLVAQYFLSSGNPPCFSWILTDRTNGRTCRSRSNKIFIDPLFNLTGSFM